MPSWFSVNGAQVSVGVGVGVAVVGQVQVMAVAECGAISSIVVDGLMLIPVLQDLELPVQLVFQREEESSAAACVAISRWKNKIHLSVGLVVLYTQNIKRRNSINTIHTTRHCRETN